MIKNERQFRITRTQAEQLRAALEELRNRPDDGWLDLETAAVRGQLDELEHQLAEYEGLQKGTVAVGTPDTVADLPRLLIRQRIVAGLTQRDLAERLGMKEQQVQRYESDDWATANLSRLAQVAEAVGLSIATVPDLAPGPPSMDSKPMLKALRAQGVDTDFIRRRLQPARYTALENVVDLTARLHRIYGWAPSDIVRGTLGPPEPQLAAASFKMPARVRRTHTDAYIVYSQYLAFLTLEATSGLPSRSVPNSADEMRAVVLSRFDNVDFGAVLFAAWELGIPVLPLADPGAFHAVLWRFGGRNVVVLKQQNRSASRWAFDLLHEIRHAAEEPGAETYLVIDDVDSGGKAEQAANRFAGDVLLHGRAEEIAQEAVERANGSVRLLKKAAVAVAEDNDVAVADLANYLAYRLGLQGIDWWGTAQNLQSTRDDPWALARQYLLERCDIGRLGVLDRDLLLQAITDGGEGDG